MDSVLLSPAFRTLSKFSEGFASISPSTVLLWAISDNVPLLVPRLSLLPLGVGGCPKSASYGRGAGGGVYVMLYCPLKAQVKVKKILEKFNITSEKISFYLKGPELKIYED